MRVKCPKCEREYPIARGSEVICPCGHRFPVKGNEVKLPEIFCDEDFFTQPCLQPVSDNKPTSTEEDIEYFQKNLYAAMGIPPDMLGR